MNTPVLDILIVPTYNTKTLAVFDNSFYPNTFVIQSPTVKITVPSFHEISVPFTPKQLNVFSSYNLGLSAIGDSHNPLPDGIYKITYSVNPAYEYNVTKTIMRVDKLQEQFDELFMRLDMMECDRAIKRVAKMELDSIYLMIQGSLSAANNCSYDVANKLYITASRKIESMKSNNCGCHG